MYFLAYREAAGLTEDIDYVIQLPGMTDAATIRARATEVGLNELSFAEAMSQSYRTVYLFPAHVYFDTLSGVLSQLNWDDLVISADGFRNSLLLEGVRHGQRYELELLSRVRERVYFHSVLEEQALIESLPTGFGLPPATCLSSDHIAAQWNAVFTRLGASQSNVIPQLTLAHDDVCVIARDWQYDFRYGMRSESALFDATRAMIELGPKPKRIVFRPLRDNPDTRAADGLSQQLEGYCVELGIEFVSWRDFTAFSSAVSDATEVVHPESLLLTKRLSGSGRIIAYDGTVSLISGLSDPDLEVVWPDQIDLDVFTLNGRVSGLIREQANWMRDMLKQPPGSTLHTPGALIFAAHGDLFHRIDTDHVHRLETLLAREHAASTRLQDELEAIQQTISWRLTAPLRRIRRLRSRGR